MSLGRLITIHELGVPFGKPRKGSKVCYYFSAYFRVLVKILVARVAQGKKEEIVNTFHVTMFLQSKYMWLVTYKHQIRYLKTNIYIAVEIFDKVNNLLLLLVLVLFLLLRSMNFDLLLCKETSFFKAGNFVKVVIFHLVTGTKGFLINSGLRDFHAFITKSQDLF